METTATVDKSVSAEASSAHSRINIPLNLENWKALTADQQQLLMWFHQHALDGHMNWPQAVEALGYDNSTIYRVLKGTYEGSWANVCSAIRSYKKLIETRGTIIRQEFTENSISKLIWAALDYALANNSITLIAGDSRRGKSVASREWRDRNNHGRSVLVIAPAYGGAKALLRDIAAAVGVNRNLSAVQMHESILRAFNKNRILIVDEAHRLLPSDRRSQPTNLEILRDIHDRTGAALALIATQRFEAVLRSSEYQFEQLLGRIGMPVKLPKEVKREDYVGIVRQFVTRPSKALLDSCHKAANGRGSLGILVETLKVASRIAAKARVEIDETHVARAFALREQMSQGVM
jgi:DNA transposition AAA+ family ATPase